MVPGSLYLSQLKWKLGERRAVTTARGISGGRLLPLFRLTPSRCWDNDRREAIEVAEHLDMVGPTLREIWGTNQALLDCAALDCDAHRSRIAGILTRARSAGARVSPVIEAGTSAEHMGAVRDHIRADAAARVCIRLGLRDIESDASAMRAIELLEAAGAPAMRAILLIDGGPIHVSNTDEFLDTLIDAFAHIPQPHAWTKVFWSCTSFPEEIKGAPGSISRLKRKEWEIYRGLLRRASELPVVPMYSDYALEFPKHLEGARVPPTAHLRYSTESDYVISHGRSTKKPNSYSEIFPVASALCAAPEFLGPDFSEGDAFISRLARSQTKTGHASDWRWAATDHHLSLVIGELRKIFSLPEDAEPIIETADGQIALV